MIVRRMLAADIGRVIEIADGLPQAPRWSRDIYEAALNPESAPYRIALVAQDSGARVVGFLITSVVAPEAELETIGVATDCQRLGAARTLIREARGLLAGRGVTRVTLEVRESNAAAQQLYRSCGFVPIARRGSYYVDPKEDAVVMALQVGPPTSSTGAFCELST
jgi:ribosomal-protein-alanine N-acetyltransferase